MKAYMVDPTKSLPWPERSVQITEATVRIIERYREAKIASIANFRNMPVPVIYVLVIHLPDSIARDEVEQKCYCLLTPVSCGPIKPD